MKSFVNTVVGGMIGLAALYVVGRIAYQAGHDMAEAECRYDEIKRQTQALEAPKDRRDECEKKEPVVQREEPDVIVATVPKKQPRSLMTGVMQMIGGKKESVISRLLKHPDEHRVEAFVDGEELRIDVKPRHA